MSLEKVLILSCLSEFSPNSAHFMRGVFFGPYSAQPSLLISRKISCVYLLCLEDVLL